MRHRQRFAALIALAALVVYIAAATAVWLALKSAGITDPAAYGEGSLFAALAGGVGALTLLALYVLLDRRLLRPTAALSREVQRLVQSRQVDRGLTVPPRHQLGSLPDAVSALVDELRLARRDLVRGMESATARIAEQKEWLEVILLELSEGVIVCSPSHQILLYNETAVRLLDAPEAMGLGRSLFAVVTAEPVLHTLERLDFRRREGGASSELMAPFVCATIDARTMLRANMALILGPVRELAGYVVTLTDISHDVARFARAEAVHRALTRGLRGPLANLRAAAETLSTFAGMSAEERRAFEGVILGESVHLSEQLDALAAQSGSQPVVHWPMADVYSADMLNCVARRLADDTDIALTVVGIPLWLHGDSLSLVAIFGRLLRRLRAFTGTTAFDAEALLGDRHVYVDLAWTGGPVPSQTIETWLDLPLEGTLGPQTIRDVLDRHGSELWSQSRPHARAVLRVPLLAPTRPQFQERPRKLPPRPEFYDFALMTEHSVAGERALRSLRELDYVVFDTETTGLRPADGDQIVSLAGVRVVNGRILSGERFARLVDPQRPIPRDSVRFHGITDEMVAHKPPAHVVLPQFKAFVGDAVMVAHNAAFDLKFIRLKEPECGAAFRNPVIDTLLLSVLIEPDEEDHSLDGIAQRLGVAIADRHTALGDALATAEILVHMIDRLEAKGIRTLQEVMQASNMMAELRLREQRF
jgi:DNA polymerase-3 subunit epsilon